MKNPRPSSGSCWALTLILAGLPTAIIGCASTPQSTRLRASDFDVTVQEMVNELAGSDFLADRTADSSQMRIVAQKVENLSSDVMSKSEMWTTVARVQSALPVQELSQNRNIVFQIPPDQIAALRRRGFEVPLTPENQPTHTLAATFRSATRATATKEVTDVRKDYYYIEYRITNLDTRVLVWNGQFEFAREAKGTTIN